MTDLSIIRRRDSYDDYDHSDEELYVYDQCCQNCRYYNETNGCSRFDREEYESFPLSSWCVDWKNRSGRK